MEIKAVIQFDDRNSTVFKYGRATGLTEVEISVASTDDIGGVSYGVVSNYGSVSVIDYNFDLYVFLSRVAFTSSKITVYNENKVIGTYYGSRAVSYDVYSHTATIDFKGVLEKWQDVKFELHYGGAGETTTAYTVYERLVDASGDFEFVIDTETADFLKSITIEFMYLEEATLWEQWNKLAQIGQLRIYLNEDGNVVVKRYV